MPTTSSSSVVKKRALIISNSSYTDLPSLLYTTTDAQDLCLKLKKLHFDVTFESNLTFEQMETIIDDFLNSICEREIVFFFFNGHAASSKNQNYLLPVDDDEISNIGMLQYHSVNATKFLQQITGRDPSAVIFLLDSSYDREMCESSLKSSGLCSMTAQPASLVMFTCAVGQTIENSTNNDRNGIFLEHLLQYLHLTHWTIEEILERVAQDVQNQTNKNQIPFLSNALRSRKTYLDLQHRKSSLCPADIHSTARWIQQSFVVAGGHGSGLALNQLSNPWTIYIEDNQNLLIADQLNHRIVEWEHGSTHVGRLVAGGNGPGDETNQLNCPTDVIIDKNGTHLIICDRDNQRIVRWPRHNGTRGQILISNIDCVCLSMDNEGYLYVSDDHKHEVRRYAVGDTEGTRVAGGNGRGDRLDQFNEPRYIFVDQNRSIYVSDNGNHRVMKWTENATEGIIVAGGNNKGHDLSQLYFPQGIIVDQTGALYVADGENKRIVRWTKGSHQGSVVIGDSHHEERTNLLNRPFGISFDQLGNLYAVDMYNHRVLQYPVHIDS